MRLLGESACRHSKIVQGCHLSAQYVRKLLGGGRSLPLVGYHQALISLALMKDGPQVYLTQPK